ncbi:MAG TPA: LacI family DNA-binding transcriptional regulator [Candidatus Aminicenantes bacterium]|nr:LacI family DNA-binding transcriptional regulator [Candidatus Aminicenantes bacterium]HRY65694.1 LacI family DNA-binding transcriptional regulator [Candidatus Aminicenantes bacterium]HRZ72608.1 LacI family DNA-binding transcriptional regulator [Candidatus Aminicenantes bacterium]
MSIKRIQERTGFSYSTISRVLNGKAKEFRISDPTRDAIMEAAKEINYRPNMLAQSLRMRKTYTIGLIVPDIQNPFFGELAWRIERKLRGHGYSTILCNTDEISENEEFYLQVLVDRRVDGIIIAPVHTEEWPGLEEIRRRRSVVLIDRTFYETDMPWVTSSNEQAADQMASALLRLGFTRIAFLGGVPGTYVNTVRFWGFRKAFERQGLPIDNDLVLNEGYSPAAGEKMMTDLLARSPDIRAVFCVNNLVFLGAMKTVQTHELKTADRILMSAFDISPYCGMFKRPLVCASQNREKLADTAVSLLLRGIEDPLGTHDHVTIPIDLSLYRIA